MLGDPVVVNVEAISARTNHPADTVSGEAPNSAEVLVAQGNGNNQVIVRTDVKIDGSYSADFSGVRDLEPPMNGQMVARLLSGHELFTTWAAVRMTTELREPFLSGNGPPNRDVTAQLIDADGVTVVATGSDAIGGGGQGPGGNFGGGGGNWFFNFTDGRRRPGRRAPDGPHPRHRRRRRLRDHRASAARRGLRRGGHRQRRDDRPRARSTSRSSVR